MVANIVQNHGFGSILTGHLVRNRDTTNQTSLADRLHKPESTLRTWLTGNRSPDVDWIIHNAHLLPDDVLWDLLTAVGAGKYVPAPASPSIDSRILAATAEALSLTGHVAKVAKSIHAAEADGYVTKDEAAPILQDLRLIAMATASLTAHFAALIGRTLCVRALARRRA